MSEPARILFCNCTYAQVVPKEVKEGVLKTLCQSGKSFDAVADLCEMSARRDPALRRLAAGGPVKIAACYPRAVKWLFAAAQAPLQADSAQVLNMRVSSADEISQSIFADELVPNLPHKEKASEPAHTGNGQGSSVQPGSNGDPESSGNGT